MTDSSPITYLCLLTEEAPKLGRNGGTLRFKILADTERQHVFLTIVGNSGGGCFSPEIVNIDAIERCLPADREQPFAAKALASAFQGKSANQPGFCAAILRSLSLLLPVEGNTHLHQVGANWSEWKNSMLALPGEPYVPPTKAELLAARNDSSTEPGIIADTPPADHENLAAAPSSKAAKDRRDKQGGRHARPA